MGSNTDGIDVRSVGNSQVLQETQLVEAFNLKVSGSEPRSVFNIDNIISCISASIQQRLLTP